MVVPWAHSSLALSVMGSAAAVFLGKRACIALKPERQVESTGEWERGPAFPLSRSNAYSKVTGQLPCED